MKANSLSNSRFRCTDRPSAPGADRPDRSALRLAELHAELSATPGRLSIVVADYDGARNAAPLRLTAARARLAAAVLVDGCAALDRVAELPVLARDQAHRARRPGPDVVAQADRLASVSARLAAMLRGEGTGFRGDLAALSRFDCLAGLGPNETDESLILAAENVSQALSLAARLVLVLARLDARAGRASRLTTAVRLATALRLRTAGWTARWVRRWAVRVAALPLSTDLVHGCLGPGLLPPCAVLLVVTLLDRLTGSRIAGRPDRSGESATGCRRPRHNCRAHRNQ